jgi:hypothetical protein
MLRELKLKQIHKNIGEEKSFALYIGVVLDNQTWLELNQYI